MVEFLEGPGTGKGIEGETKILGLVSCRRIKHRSNRITTMHDSLVSISGWNPSTTGNVTAAARKANAATFEATTRRAKFTLHLKRG